MNKLNLIHDPVHMIHDPNRAIHFRLIQKPWLDDSFVPAWYPLNANGRVDPLIRDPIHMIHDPVIQKYSLSVFVT